MIELIIVIEINPYDFAKNEYESPMVSMEENPEACHSFWLKSISDSGLQNLEAIQKGSYLVDTTTINEAEWETILQQHLEEIEWDFYDDQIGKLSGGIAMLIDDHFMIVPECCGDIGMINDWEMIPENASTNWTQLWIGHPWIYYRRNGNHIEFSDYTELSLDDFKDTEQKFSIAETALKEQLLIIKQQHNELKSNFQKALEKMNIPHSETIAKLMTGNE